MSKRAAEIIYSEFGLRAFRTRDISPDGIARLGRTLKVSAGDPIRNVKIGQRLSAMENKAYTLKSGVRVKMSVARPNNDRRPCRFRLVDLAAPLRAALFGSSGAPVPAPAGALYDVLLVRAGVGYMASCPAFPGCHTWGRSETEALAKLRDAIARRRQDEARAAELRMQAMRDEYRTAGYAVRRTTVRAPEQPSTPAPMPAPMEAAYAPANRPGGATLAAPI